jgi:hypothetical protein
MCFAHRREYGSNRAYHTTRGGGSHRLRARCTTSSNTWHLDRGALVAFVIRKDKLCCYLKGLDYERYRRCRKGVAEREGFEPPVHLRVLRISSAVRSTTLPPLRGRQRGASSAHSRSRAPLSMGAHRRQDGGAAPRTPKIKLRLQPLPRRCAPRMAPMRPLAARVRGSRRCHRATVYRRPDGSRCCGRS